MLDDSLGYQCARLSVRTGRITEAIELLGIDGIDVEATVEQRFDDGQCGISMAT
jgi:hypothetical protein